VTDTWWQRGVIYQIYPRSFQDSNGDGIGDLDGILQRLEYCASLGVDVVWLSPIYPSPMADFGYDVSDYTDVHPMFGTLAAFDELAAELKRRDMKLILDYRCRAKLVVDRFAGFDRADIAFHLSGSKP
jgi:alpha-glucosidase